MHKIVKYFPILGLLFIGVGLTLISYNYLLLKKNKVYERIGLEMFDYYSEVNVETNDLENDTQTYPDDNKVNINLPETNEDKENSKEEDINEPESINYYVGTLEIPKINFKRGFTTIDSVHNNLNENIQVISPSDYPDVENGNFILAGHSGNTAISFFNKLDQLVVGDIAVINYKNQRYTYEIIDIYTQPKIGVVSIKRKVDATTLTLITCTKGDKNTQTIYIAEKK